MPTTSQSLAFRIQQLSVLPVLVCIILIALGFTIIQLIENRELEHEQNQLATRWLVSLTQHSLIQNNSKHISESFGDLLEMPDIRGIYLVSPEGEFILKHGQRPNADIPGHLTDEPYYWSGHSNFYYSAPIVEGVGTNNTIHRGWIVVSINETALSIHQYQGLTLILLGLLTASTLLMVLAWRLTRSIEVPLYNVQRTLQDYSRGKFESRVPIAGCTELQNLAHSTNEVGKSLQQTQDNIRQQVEQATSDLQETLETVEIQSIELDIARKNAVAGSRAKSEFLANTTHEIRTPINGILGFTNLLLKSPLTTQQREYLRTIAHSSQGLLTIINDILDFSRLEEDELTLDRAPLNLRQVIEETLQILAPTASEKQLYLIATSEPEVPQQLLGDPLRLKQVLINLVSNAIKFSDEGDILVHSEVISKDIRSAKLKISVSDSGIGIDPKQKDSLFEAFKQADSSDSRLRGGTGLGLAIAKGLVEKMRGEITIESTLDQGTTVWFTLPLPLQQNIIEARPSGLQGKYAACYIENPLIQQQLEEYFHLWGVTSQAFSSIEALQQYLDEKPSTAPDFAFIMPSNNRGTTASLCELTKLHPALPIFVTALPDSDLAYDDSLQNADISLLFLPLSKDHLQRVLQDALVTDQAEATEPQPFQTFLADVLVVDDNPANLQLVSTFLQSLGVNVMEASSGMDAINILNAHNVDLIFMDVQMPKMDGIETTKNIRKQETLGYHVPIIALTAHNINEQRAKILKAGMDDCVSKPVSEEQLAHILKHWLGLPLSGSSAPHPIRDEHPLVGQPPLSRVMNLQEALRLSNGIKVLARDMLSKLTAELATEADHISRLYQQRNWPELQERVHRLYGGCCYCGVPELRKASATLDGLLIKGETEHIDQDLNNLLRAMQRLQDWVEEHDLDIIFDTEESHSAATDS
nr:response regulator [Aestuariicella hydrocarbonica]